MQPQDTQKLSLNQYTDVSVFLHSSKAHAEAFYAIFIMG